MIIGGVMRSEQLSCVAVEHTEHITRIQIVRYIININCTFYSIPLNLLLAYSIRNINHTD